jgi:hypothetical protein
MAFHHLIAHRNELHECDQIHRDEHNATIAIV